MRRRWKAVLAALLVLVLFALPVAAGRGRTGSGAGAMYDEALILYEGWRPAGGGEELRLPAVIRPEDGAVSLENTLPRMLQAGTYLAVYSGQEQTTVSSEGKELFSTAGSAEAFTLPRWNFMRLDQDLAGQRITLLFSGTDAFTVGRVREVLMGSYGELMMYISASSSFDRWIGLTMMLLGLLTLLFSLAAYAGREGTGADWLLGVLAILFGMSVVVTIPASDEPTELYRVLYAAGRVTVCLLPSVYCLYAGSLVAGQRRKRDMALAWAGLAWAAVYTAAWTLGPAALAPVLRVTAGIAFCALFGLCLYGDLRHATDRRLRDRVLRAAALAALIAGTLLGAFTHLGVKALHAVRPESLGALIFVLLNTTAGLFSAFDQLERRLNMERELNDGRIRLMISQIRPHFINNVMTVIRSMIRYDPDEAEEMVYSFNKYLMYNIDALGSAELCPFSLELTHIRTYLAIELTHLRPRLRVVYDIRAEDFEIPPLSVQPFVENAVKHGIAPMTGTGTLTIRSEEAQDAYVITVEDDGVGFDTSQPYDHRGGHGVGLNNAMKRLEMMVGGTVDVRSAPGQGTAVTISVPKLREEDFDEDDIG